MIPVPSGVRIWIATGHTDMRRGMRSLALQVQQSFGRDPYAGDLYIFRGRRGDLCKIIWHDGVGMSLYAKRLERGKYIWPSAVDGVPVVGELRSGTYVGYGHGCWGILLAPATGEALANQIATGESPTLDLGRFDPRRF